MYHIGLTARKDGIRAFLVLQIDGLGYHIAVRFRSAHNGNIAIIIKQKKYGN